MKNNLAKNSIIYTLKTVIGLFLPLITFPYVTRVLSVDTIGKVNFSYSIISYFSLLAGLGIFTFAVREGAKIRDQRDQWNLFASEIFSFNIITTVISYGLFILLLLLNKKWQNYTSIMLLLSTVVPLTTLGMDWVFTVYEEYVYITLRSLIVQILSVFYLLFFVKNDTDLLHYALYTVFSSVGSNILNFIRARKYVTLKWRITSNIKAYIKPILLIFLSSVATQIYLNSDITMLGYMTSDADVGLYNATVRVYNIVKTVMLALGVVSLPKLANCVGNNRQEYDSLFSKLFNVNILLLLPAAIGLASVSSDVLELFAGETYTRSASALTILAFALPFCALGSYLASGNLVLFNKEKHILVAAIIGAAANVILNFILIPYYGAAAAAATTLISELLTFSIHMFNIRKYYKIRNILTNFIQVFVSAVLMGIVCALVSPVINSLYLRLLVTISAAVLTYGISLLILRNKLLLEGISMVVAKWRKK